MKKQFSAHTRSFEPFLSKITLMLTLVWGIFHFQSCKESSNDDVIVDDGKDATESDTVTYNVDWSYASHGKADHNYDVVFPQESVNKMEITMTASQWSSVKTNMKALFGYDFGAGGQKGGEFPDGESDYIDVTLAFNGKVWKNVGFRLKGNSSLAQAWGEGNYKLPFKFNFDKFEDDYPAITNQHFYGFKELSFSPGFKDQSLMREKLATDIFRLAGIAAAQTAFYQVYIDFGAGLKYCGVYTAVEIPEDNLIKSQLGEENGNTYKPESYLKTFAEDEFDKKSNEDEADFSDVQEFITLLNSSTRTSDAAQWRTDLEGVFNIPHFLKYLAINNVMVNWDSYGVMPHNYYLYNHSEDHLTWIPWDHNEALSGNPGITGTSSSSSGPGANHTPLSLTMNEVSDNWPLVKYVAADPIYYENYKVYMQDFIQNVWTDEVIHELINHHYELISPYAIGTNGEQSGYSYLSGSSSFTSAYTDLKSHVSGRRTTAEQFLQ